MNAYRTCTLAADSADIKGEPVVRAYTPVSGDRDLGVLDFLIKVYWAGAHPQFPHGGKMSQHLAAMKVSGDCNRSCFGVNASVLFSGRRMTFQRFHPQVGG